MRGPVSDSRALDLPAAASIPTFYSEQEKTSQTAHRPMLSPAWMTALTHPRESAQSPAKRLINSCADPISRGFLSPPPRLSSRS